MKLYCLLAAASGVALNTRAVIITEPTRTFTVGYDLADIVNPGAVFQQTITDSTILSLTDVRVGLKLVGRGSGGFAGELVVALNKDLHATSLLLNRVGVSGGNPFGFGYDGWNVTFSESGTGGDVHQASLNSGLLTGEFEPDGRTSPDSAQRPALLNVFHGDTGNGDWYLSIADLEAGGTMRLESWSITLTGEIGPSHPAVPDPAALPVAPGLWLMAWLVRRFGVRPA